MEIKDLKDGAGNVSLKAEITNKGDIREINKMGRVLKVCNFSLKDGTGAIPLTLWNEDIDKVDVGDILLIKNAYVTSWQGKIQLNLNRFDKFTVLK